MSEVPLYLPHLTGLVELQDSSWRERERERRETTGHEPFEREVDMLLAIPRRLVLKLTGICITHLPATRWSTGLRRISGFYVTTFASHKALKSMMLNKSTFDETVILHRADQHLNKPR
jgi:hypothetical protein